MKATFRGVPFFVETSERGGGRRGVTHEYPGRDQAFREDLGRKVRTFPVEGHVVGDSYQSARDALLTALEKPGPGELVHPYYGTLQVAVLTYRVRESSRESRIATFSIEFEETASRPAQPEAASDGKGAVTDSAAAANDAAYAFFTAQFRVALQPQWTLDVLANVLASATETLQNELAPIIADVQQAAALKSQLDDMGAQATALVEAPALLTLRLSQTFGSLTSFPLTTAGIRALLRAYGFNPGNRPPATTTTRIQQQANFDVMSGLLAQLPLILAASLAPKLTFDSYEDAVALRNEITDRIDDQLDTARDDVYVTFFQLRTDLVKAVPGPNEDLPRLLRYDLPAMTPSLVLAHRLYGDLTREADIIARNKVAHSAFIPAGTLQVLSDD